MTTAVRPLTPPVPGAASWRAASARGSRHHLADAWSAFTHRGATAVAVADGVGDSAAAGTAARLVADHAVRAAVLEGRADTGLAAAHDLLLAATTPDGGDAAAVVALDGGDRRRSVAWVGDCRAYVVEGGVARPVTRDQTVAEQMRAAGVRVHPRFEHVLTASARTVGPGGIGVAVLDRPTTLVLVSDGVHRALSARHLAALVAAGGDPAGRIVAAALRAGATDNTTALVLHAA